MPTWWAPIPSSDVAVIKARDASGLTAIEIGDSDDLVIGEWVMTIGSPFGLEQSVATGIVSATSRSQIMDSGTDMYGQSTGASDHLPEHDPDRRGHQPRQLRRRAG